MLQFAPGCGVQVRPHLSLAPEASGPGGQKRSSSCAKGPPSWGHPQPAGGLAASLSPSQQGSRDVLGMVRDGDFCRNLFSFALPPL